MKNLCMYLPPYAPDYSGVCSALFDLKQSDRHPRRSRLHRELHRL